MFLSIRNAKSGIVNSLLIRSLLRCFAGMAANKAAKNKSMSNHHLRW